MEQVAAEPVFGCVFALSQLCQAVIADLLTNPELLVLEQLADLFRDVPNPTSHVEALAAVGLLVDFTWQAGDRIHRRVCDRGTPSCSFDAARFVAACRIDAQAPSSWNASSAMRRWYRDYAEALLDAHAGALLCGRAQERVRALLSGPATIGDVARELGCSVPVLYRRMKRHCGESPRQYRTRTRVVQAIDHLRGTAWSVESIALDVGWKSKKDLFRAFSQLVGLTPTAFRRLSEHDARVLRSRLGQPARDRTEPLGRQGHLEPGRRVEVPYALHRRTSALALGI